MNKVNKGLTIFLHCNSSHMYGVFSAAMVLYHVHYCALGSSHIQIAPPESEVSSLKIFSELYGSLNKLKNYRKL